MHFFLFNKSYSTKKIFKGHNSYVISLISIRVEYQYIWTLKCREYSFTFPNNNLNKFSKNLNEILYLQFIQEIITIIEKCFFIK